MDGQELRAVTVTDGRRFNLYPDPDPRRSGRIGYLCAVCGGEEICPRYGLPARGFSVTALASGATPRLVWVCSIRCLRRHAAGLAADAENSTANEVRTAFDVAEQHGVTVRPV